MKYLIIYCAVCIVMLCSFCNQSPVSPANNNRIGLTLYSYYPSSNSTDMVVVFFPDENFETIPEVTVNNKSPDSTSISYDQIEFRGIPSNAWSTYKFIYQNEILEDSFFIPGPIDSLFLNNKFIGKDAIVNLPLKDTKLVFSWKGSGEGKSHFTMYAPFIQNEYFSTITNEDSVSITPDYTMVQGNTIDFSISLRNQQARLLHTGSGPDKSTDHMYIYYNIYAQAYEANFYMY